MGTTGQRVDANASLAQRRTVLLARIHDARLETAAVGRLVAIDLQAADRTRLSILGGLRIAKATLLAAGLVWSLKSTSTVGRGSRLLTVTFTLLSTLQTLRKLSLLLIPLTHLAPPTGRPHHENRRH